MTKVKEILDQFNVPEEMRYSDEMENVDIGNHTLTDMEEKYDGYVLEFTSKDDKNTILRLNDDRMAVVLLEIQDDDKVKATSWRYGQKFSDTFTREEMDV